MGYIRELQVGNIKIKNNLILAPLAGITLQPLRMAVKNFGAGLVSTEMISVDALFHDNKKTIEMINICDTEHPVSVQLFGKDPLKFVKAANIAIERGADIIDVNMGCPAPKVSNHGSGSALMKTPDTAKEIIKILRKNISVPLTVKMRAGWDEKNKNAIEIAKIVEEEGADMLTVHARTKSQKFGAFDWSTINDVKNTVKIPVIGNGNIFTPMDAKRMFDETNCDGVMLARGILGKPWLFQQIIDFLNTNEYHEFSEPERLEYIKHFASDFINYRGERGIFEIRKYIGWLTKGLKDATQVRVKCFKAENLEEILESLKI